MSGLAPALFGQNSVTVTQEGNNNSVSINQSASAKKNQQTGSDRCKEIESKKLSAGHENIIKVSQQDTTIYRRGFYFTYLPMILEGQTSLKASQTGQSNGLYLTLPDSQNNKRGSIYSIQRGSQNQVAAQLTDKPQKVTLYQTGSNNSISITPCKKNR